MFALFARSICAHCLPGPSSTQEPSLPSLSPSLIISSVPTIGLLSLAVTFLFFARLTVPTGTRKSGRLAFVGRSRLVTLRGTGVPTKRGGGSLVFKGTLSCATAAGAARSAIRTARFFTTIFIIVSGFHFFRSDGKSRLRGNGVIRFVDSIFAAESFIAGAIQFCRAANGVEKVFQVRLMRRFVEKHRNFIFRQLCGFAYVHLRGVRCGSRPGADISLLDQVVP